MNQSSFCRIVCFEIIASDTCIDRTYASNKNKWMLRLSNKLKAVRHNLSNLPVRFVGHFTSLMTCLAP